jgi:hypothetical protein
MPTYDINLHASSPKQPNENPAEGVIREICKIWFRLMQATNLPKQLWDFGVIWVCELMQGTTSSLYHSNGITPIEIIPGDTLDISEHLVIDLYD